MGVLGSARLGACACGRRRPSVGTSPPPVCPVSGKSGECPIGQSAARAAKAAPNASAAPARAGRKAEPDADAVAAAAKHKERGGEHFRKQEFEEALDAYRDALLLTPKDPSLWLNRSIVNRQLENWEDAQEDAEIAVELQPSNAKAHYSRALALQHLGESRKALASCKAGLAAQPDNKALQQLRITVERALEAGGSDSKKEARGGNLSEVCAQQPDNTAAGECPVSVLKNNCEEIKAEASQLAYQWRSRNPSDEERECLKSMLVGAFRNKYAELKAASAAHAAKTVLNTDQYEKGQKQGLQLKGGHQPLRRPDHVDLPVSYRQPMGVISVEKLGEHSSHNEQGRFLLSVYGHVFDVSDRPDKYGHAGPYAQLTGKDLTWGLFAGIDTPDYCDRFYDLFKAKDLGKDKLAGLCSWLAWYETEYGAPVGRLEPYTRERELPPPPLQEVDDACNVM